MRIDVNINGIDMQTDVLVLYPNMQVDIFPKESVYDIDPMDRTIVLISTIYNGQLYYSHMSQITYLVKDSVDKIIGMLTEEVKNSVTNSI